MDRKIIYLGSIEQAIKFVRKASKNSAGLRLVSGSSYVNAKSLLGVFSLNLLEPITLEITGDSTSRENAIQSLSSYIQ